VGAVTARSKTKLGDWTTIPQEYPLVKTPFLRNPIKNGWQLTVIPYLLFICLPLFSLFYNVKPGEMIKSFSQPEVYQAVILSIQTSTAAALLSILLGTPVAYYLSHPQYSAHQLIDTIVDLPTVLPPAVAGVALLLAFGRNGLLGGSLSVFGISLPFTQAAVVLAQTFISASLYIKAAAIGFRNVDCEMKKAAALDGANHLQLFRYIDVPIALPAMLSGVFMTWARALGEFGATIIFAGNFPGRTQTMPLAIYLGFEMDFSVAMTLSVILVGLSFLALILMRMILKRNISLQN
jgi:molybdate transport system permease protein